MILLCLIFFEIRIYVEIFHIVLKVYELLKELGSHTVIFQKKCLLRKDFTFL